MYRYFKRVSGFGSDNYIYSWRSKGLSGENITAPTTTDYSLNPQLSYLGAKTREEFKESCLKQDKIAYDHGKIVNFYIVLEISKNYDIGISPTLKNVIFAAVILTKNADIDMYKYFGYGIGFDRKGFFQTIVMELVKML